MSKVRTYPLTSAALAMLLHQAAEAHHAFEKTLGYPDPNWEGWYAEHIMRQLDASRGPIDLPDTTS